MSKNNAKQFFAAGIMLLLLFINTHNIAWADNLRPVKIKVLDAVSKDPIAGIKVEHYLLSREYTAGLFNILTFFDIAVPSKIKVLLKKDYITDKNGQINIEGQNVDFGIFEGINEESFFVNINWQPDELDRYLIDDELQIYTDKHLRLIMEKGIDNINKNYKGFCLNYLTKRKNHNEKIKSDPEYKKMLEKKTYKNYDTLIKFVDWEGSPEEYVIELRR